MSTYSTTSATPFILPISGSFATDAASPGTVTGTARVIVSLDGQERLAPGDDAALDSEASLAPAQVRLAALNIPVAKSDTPRRAIVAVVGHERQQHNLARVRLQRVSVVLAGDDVAGAVVLV